MWVSNVVRCAWDLRMRTGVGRGRDTPYETPFYLRTGIPEDDSGEPTHSKR